MTAGQLTAEQLRILDAEVETVVFNLTWYRVRRDDTVKCDRLTGQNGGAFVCDRLLPPATAALYRAWGWSVKAISPEEGLVGFLAENAGEIPRGRLWETPRYSTDIAAAWEMEEELQRRGLGTEYGMDLMALVVTPETETGQKPFTFAFDTAHASPELRCKAALMTVREAAHDN